MRDQEQLELTFLATGAWQHVFVKSDGTEDSWVYKIPATFGYILPFNHPKCHFRSNEIFAKTLLLLLILLPNRLHRKTYQQLVIYMENRGWSRCNPLLKSLGRAIQLPPAIGEKVLRRHLKRTTAAHFEAMLDVIAHLARNGIADILLPYRIIRNRKAILHFEGKAFSYGGPILMQRRAEFLFEENEHLESFEWREMVEAQHRLWRHGITLRRLHVIFGPRGWALLDGRLRLCDTSGLTRSLNTARRALSQKELDNREKSALARMMQVKPSEPAADYISFMRRKINRKQLDQLWRADLSTTKSQ